ncbi:MAG: Uma2 family endonuclease [Deltaproteobacteria bacterium]|nr:Uma2 family endonuclease [Deltaproteobacteria bacterium]
MAAIQTTTAPLMTAEELLQLPDDGYRYALVEGGLIRMPPAGGEHGDVTMNAGFLLKGYVKAHKLGVVSAAETGFILQRSPDTVRAPDASFVSKDRIPPDGIPKGYWPFAPDLAVEVVSPNDRFDDVQEKVAQYFVAGTRLVWVVLAKTRTVLVYRSLHDVSSLSVNDELNGVDVLPGFTCRVAELFE